MIVDDLLLLGRKSRVRASPVSGLSCHALRATVRRGALDAADAATPPVALGSKGAERLGIARPGVAVWLREHWGTVVGILDPIKLAADLDSAGLIGLLWPADRAAGAPRDARTDLGDLFPCAGLLAARDGQGDRRKRLI
jgi:hypothetical protein